MNDQFESRAVPMEVEPSRDGRTLDGYVAVFNSRTRIPDRNGDFEEEIKPGAFRRSLKENGTPLMMWDHGKDPRVGTVPIGKWDAFDEDRKGYHVRGHLLDNPVVEPVRQAIADGAVTGLSFRFKVSSGGDKWERRSGRGGVDLRHVHDCDVHEAGPVAFPAYKDARVSIRSLMEMDLPILRSFDEDEDAEERTVVAYAVTWGGITEQRGTDGRPVRVRTGRHALDEWLRLWNEDGRPPWPIMREHGQDGHSRAVGRLVDAECDEFGLLTTSVYDDTAEGRAALEDIHRGVLRGYSQHLQVVESRDVDGVAEVTRGVLVECGPTTAPFDRGAHIIEAGGVFIETRADEFSSIDDVIDFIRVRTGVDTDTLMARARAEERKAVQSLTNQVHAADALARAVAERRSVAADAYFTWSRFHRGADFETALAADRDEADLMAELRNVLLFDRDLVSRVLASARAPEYRSPFRSTRAAISAAGLR